MNIIIVGAGKVGTTIADQLSSENHNITIIDLNQKKVEEAEEEFDAMGIVGNGASHSGTGGGRCHGCGTSDRSYRFRRIESSLLPDREEDGKVPGQLQE